MAPVAAPIDTPSGGDAATEHSAPPPATAERPALPPDTLNFAAKMFDLARTGDLKLIHYLAAGLPPNMANQRGDSLLMLAAYHGHEELVSAMLGHSPTPISPSTTRTTSESESDSNTTAEHAIPILPPSRQPDVNQLNAKHQSILAGTVFKSYPSIAALLVRAGADPLAGEPSAEETATIFRKLDGDGGYRELFEGAPGRGRGGVLLKEELAPASQPQEAASSTAAGTESAQPPS
ncbi:hypothetical protein A4X13_0g3570 [Tilletia indica]|uniref:Ankyrin repeat protein n=1 Tax=Tilletia indica TaxID=43049 RepID=A0A177TNH6_9BASI|nr:hypothetical protein A4X13_0g3570 [Tilletia indica]